MYRIGIIGSENSHALAFTKIFNLSGQYEDLRVVGIAGENPEASKKVFQEGQLDFIAGNPQEFIGRVDAMMITSRHGGLHPGYARPFIEMGMPVFVDKPFTDKQDTARDLLDLAVRCNAPIMGGSSTKLVADALTQRDVARNAGNDLLGGHVWAPVSMVNDYGGFSFYASHLVEITLTIFGYSPLAVRALRTPAGVSACLEYDRFTVALSLMDEFYKYGCTVLTKQGVFNQNIDVSPGYEIETAHFAEMVRTGKMPQPISELLLPVTIINAIEAAYTSGQQVPIATK